MTWWLGLTAPASAKAATAELASPQSGAADEAGATEPAPTPAVAPRPAVVHVAAEPAVEAAPLQRALTWLFGAPTVAAETPAHVAPTLTVIDEVNLPADGTLASPSDVRLVRGRSVSFESNHQAQRSPVTPRLSPRQAVEADVEYVKEKSSRVRKRRNILICVAVAVALAVLLGVIIFIIVERVDSQAAASRELPAGAGEGESLGNASNEIVVGFANLPKPPPPLPPPPSTAGTVGMSMTIASDSIFAFDLAAFRRDLAHALEISTARVQIESVQAGSLVVQVQIAPRDAGSTEPTSAAVRSVLLTHSPAQLQARFPPSSPFVVEAVQVDGAPPSSSTPFQSPSPAPPPSPPSSPSPPPSAPRPPPSPFLPPAPPPSPPPPKGNGWPIPSLPDLPDVPDVPGLPDLPHPPDVPALPSLPPLNNGSSPTLPLPPFTVPDWWPWEGVLPPVPPQPFDPSVPTGVPTPPNLTTSAAIDALWTNWLGLWWNRNRTRFPEDGQLLREPYSACSLNPVATANDRAVQLLAAMRDAAPSHDFAAGTSSMWIDAARVSLGASDRSSLFFDELNQTAALLQGRRAQALDALPIISVLLLTAAQSSALGDELLDALRAGVVAYSYWLDEFGGPESQVEACGELSAAARTSLLDRGDLDSLTYWTDDEAIVLHAAQHLLGHALPDALFAAACRTGAQQRERGRTLVLSWLQRRLSPSMGISVMQDDVALGRVISALAALADLSPVSEVRMRSQLALDMLLLQVSIAAHEGTLPMSRGQSTAGLGGFSLSSNLVWLIGGKGTCLLGEPASAALALTMLRNGYRVPRVLTLIQDRLEPAYGFDGVMRTRDAADVDVGSADWLGLSYGKNASIEDCEYWLSLGGAAAPISVECPFILGRAYGFSRGPLSAYRYLRPLAGITLDSAPSLVSGWFGRGGDDDDAAVDETKPKMTLLGGALRLVSPAARGSVKYAAHFYQFRMGGVSLTSLLDYNPGALVVTNRHPMTASLRPAEHAIVFVSQPAKPAFRASAHDWWSVQASMPRVAQWREISISIYNPPLEVSALLPFMQADVPPQLTHAYFNKSAFDEYTVVVGRDRRATWHCGRKGSGYVALLSYEPAAFADSGPYAHVDLQANGYRNVWITHVGDESRDGSFGSWTNTVRKGWVNVDILPPGPDRDGGLPWCLWQNQCIVGFPDQIDYWRLVKCVQWIPFINRKPPCDHTVETMGFIRCYLRCELPDWRLCIALCAIKSIDWSIPSGTFGKVEVEYVPYGKPALEFGWDSELLVGRRWNAVRREPYSQENARFDTPFVRLEAGPEAKLVDVRVDGGVSMNLDFGKPPRRTIVNQP